MFVKHSRSIVPLRLRILLSDELLRKLGRLETISPTIRPISKTIYIMIMSWAVWQRFSLAGTISCRRPLSKPLYLSISQITPTHTTASEVESSRSARRLRTNHCHTLSKLFRPFGKRLMSVLGKASFIRWVPKNDELYLASSSINSRLSSWRSSSLRKLRASTSMISGARTLQIGCHGVPSSATYR